MGELLEQSDLTADEKKKAKKLSGDKMRAFLRAALPPSGLARPGSRTSKVELLAPLSERSQGTRPVVGATPKMLPVKAATRTGAWIGSRSMFSAQDQARVAFSLASRASSPAASR